MFTTKKKLDIVLKANLVMQKFFLFDLQKRIMLQASLKEYEVPVSKYLDNDLSNHKACGLD